MTRRVVTEAPTTAHAPRAQYGRLCRAKIFSKDVVDASEGRRQAQLAADKAAMVSRHLAAEKLEKASTSNAVVRFGKAAGRKTEYLLFLCKEYALNTPGCATGRSGLERAASGLETVKAKTVDGAGMAKAQAMKVLQPDKVKK